MPAPRLGVFLPGLGERGAEAVPAQLGEHDLAERAAVQQLADGAEIAVPAAIVKGADQQAPRPGQRDQRLAIGKAGGKGLVDHDMLACLQRPARKRGMGVVGRSDDDQIDVRIGEQRVGGGDGHAGMARMHLVGARGGDGGERELGHGGHQRRMEGHAAQAIADHSGADHATLLVLLPGRSRSAPATFQSALPSSRLSPG